jgi:hypothetical protein
MAQSLQERVAARGFPVYDTSGQSGQGALQSSTTLPAVTGLPSSAWTDPDQDPAAVPAVLPAPEEYVLGLSLWGLPAAPNPDSTPHMDEYDSGRADPEVFPSAAARGDSAHVPVLQAGYPQGPAHAAPLIDPPTDEPSRWLAYVESDATRAPGIDTSEEVLNPAYGSGDVGWQGVMAQDHVGPREGNGQSTQEPMHGQHRALASHDAVQGYGGGGKGPGGTNLPQLTEDHRDYPGSFYSADAFVQAGEVPFLVADAAQFDFRLQPGRAAWTGVGWSFPMTTVRAQDPVTSDVPSQGAPLAPAGGSYAYAPGFWG